MKSLHQAEALALYQNSLDHDGVDYLVPLPLLVCLRTAHDGCFVFLRLEIPTIIHQSGDFADYTSVVLARAFLRKNSVEILLVLEKKGGQTSAFSFSSAAETSGKNISATVFLYGADTPDDMSHHVEAFLDETAPKASFLSVNQIFGDTAIDDVLRAKSQTCLLAVKGGQHNGL